MKRNVAVVVTVVDVVVTAVVDVVVTAVVDAVVVYAVVDVAAAVAVCCFPEAGQNEPL